MRVGVDGRKIPRAAEYGPINTGYWCYDRFRTDVTWEEQLSATERFLKRLAPIARDLGIHMNLETHEEITSFEVVRLVEAVGPDSMGITFDTGNVTQRGEDSLAAARRIAPYVRQTHLKDVVQVRAEDGLRRQVRACGYGLVDFATIVPSFDYDRTVGFIEDSAAYLRPIC
jgi:sugar phosphate isomerase/epimerase